MLDTESRLPRALWLVFWGVLIVMLDFTITLDGAGSRRIDLVNDAIGAVLIFMALPEIKRAAPDAVSRWALLPVAVATAMVAFDGVMVAIAPGLTIFPAWMAWPIGLVMIVAPMAYCVTAMRIADDRSAERARSTWKSLLIVLVALHLAAALAVPGLLVWVDRGGAAPSYDFFAPMLALTLLILAAVTWGFLRGTRLLASGR